VRSRCPAWPAWIHSGTYCPRWGRVFRGRRLWSVRERVRRRLLDFDVRPLGEQGPGDNYNYKFKHDYKHKQHKHKLHSIDATIAEASALEGAQTAQAASAKKELDQASADVRTLEDEEKDLLKRQAELKSSKTKAAALVEEKKKALREVQQTLSLAEALAPQAETIKESRKKRKAAAEMVEDAKKKRQEALEGTKAALAAMATAKGKGKGGKSSAAPDEADTVPATLQDDAGDDIE